jgi:hypothetical protein
MKHLRSAAVPLLLLLGFTFPSHSAQQEWEFHTSPGDWEDPRTFHTPFEEDLVQLQVGRVEAEPGDLPRTWSPNKAYWFVERENTIWDVDVDVFNERDYLVRISFAKHKSGAVQARWINEKLI